MRRLGISVGIALAALLGTAPASHAVVTVGPSFQGNECGGQGGFANCYASTTGTRQGALAGYSPSIYKRNSDGTADFGSFASITGGEFGITFNATANTLSFIYTPGPGDPEIHYFVIFQAGTSQLFYDTTAPITSYTATLSTYFPNNPGYSHITFFDTGSTTVVPEPASLALLGTALLGLALGTRRKRG